jgi:CheY-like chemotaxis protein
VTRLLYVEDNDDNVYMLKMRLELLDEFEVLVAEDGEKGCAAALEHKPDLILMDLDLPVIDGWEATRRLKNDPRTRAIPVIALSAHALAGARENQSKPDATNSIPSRSSSNGCWARSGISSGDRARPVEMESVQATNSACSPPPCG